MPNNNLQELRRKLEALAKRTSKMRGLMMRAYRSGNLAKLPIHEGETLPVTARIG